MTNPKQTIRHLLNKTVANGCTPAEAESARGMAEVLAAKFNLNLADLLKPETSSWDDIFKGYGYKGSSTRDSMKARKVREYQEFVRRQAEKKSWEKTAAGFSKEWKERPKASKKAEQASKSAHQEKAKDFKTVREFCEYWIKNTTSPWASIAEMAQQKFGGNTSPASVRWYVSKMRGQGIDIPKRKRG